MTSSGLNVLSNVPTLGIGLGFRGSLKTATFQAFDASEGGFNEDDPLIQYPKQSRCIDWLEMTPENYMGKGGHFLEDVKQVAQTAPTASHGVSLSIGSADPVNEAYLSELKQLFEVIQPHWFSDHLCFSSIDGDYFNDLLPLPRNQAVVEHVADRIKHVQDVMQRPFLVENISFYLDDIYAQLGDADFTAAICEKADCGLLLDVNNVFVNFKNHSPENKSWDPKQYIQALPLERVVEIHMAGHWVKPNGQRIDTHSEPICDEVFDLFAWTLAQEGCRPKAVLLERDGNYPAFSELEAELRRLSEIWMASGLTRPVSLDGLIQGNPSVEGVSYV